jgi:hypothetical protein
MSSLQTRGLGLCTHFTAGLHLRLTLSHTYTAQYFDPAPWTWETWFHPKRQLLGCLTGSWSDSPSVFWGRPEFKSVFLPVWWVALPLLVPKPHWGSVVHLRPSPSLAGRTSLSSGSNCPFVPGGITSPGDLGNAHWRQGRWKNHYLHNPGSKPPRNVMGNLNRNMGHWGSVMLAQTEQACIQRLSPENKKGSHPI